METQACPQCGAANRAGYHYCKQCGASLAAPSFHEGGQQTLSSLAYQTPAPSFHETGQQTLSSPVYQAPAPAVQSQQPIPAISYSQTPGQATQMGSSVATLGATGQGVSIWGPFAGAGTRREHVAWLLQGLGSRAEELRDTITSIFNQRQIPGASVNLVLLTGKGIAVEQRPFYRIQRGLSTVWLYVARFGQDLYVSQVSYVKGHISIFRLVLLGLLLVMSTISLVNGLAVMWNLSEVASTASLFGRGVEPNSFLISTLCCTGPLGSLAMLLLQLAGAFSLYKFLTEKDILALFRSRPSEFQEDDIVSLDKSVNETVRCAADTVGIDLELLTPNRAHRSAKRLF